METKLEDLRKWFGKGKKGDWVRVGTDGEIKGDCAREPGEGKPKCMPRSKAHSMSKKDRASAARRKRRADPMVDRPGTGNTPIMVKTDKKEGLEEKNVPTNPKLWAKFKAQAKAKFDVYPSAYANGWAAKQYKAAGGGWKTESVQEMKTFRDIYEAVSPAQQAAIAIAKKKKGEKPMNEKSVSQAQQKMMGMALAYKRGEMDDASPEVKKMADSMSMKDLEDFAKTKHKGLPAKKESVEEARVEVSMNFFEFRQKINEVRTRKDASADLYFDSYSAAVQRALAAVNKQGFEVDQDDWHNSVTTGSGKPGRGKTVRHTIGLTKGGKLQRKALHIQVYNRDTPKKPYELNFYVS